MVLRRDPGPTKMTFSTHPSFPISTKSIPIALLPGGVVALAVNHERRETPVGEGVMSHSHQRNQPPTHAHSHLITDHPHLHPLTGTTFKHTPLTHSSASLKVASYSLVTVDLLPRICRSVVCLPRKGLTPRKCPDKTLYFLLPLMFDLLFTRKPDL